MSKYLEYIIHIIKLFCLTFSYHRIQAVLSLETKQNTVSITIIKKLKKIKNKLFI